MPGFFYFRLMKDLNKQAIDLLDEEQKLDLLLAYEESFNDDSLLSHEDVKAQHTKWLKLPSK
jgi:hypothetical protein